MESTADLTKAGRKAGRAKAGSTRRATTPQQSLAIILIKEHGPVVVTRIGSEIELTLADGAPMFHIRVFRSLLEKGIIVPSKDGLFEGETQSYRLQDWQ